MIRLCIYYPDPEIRWGGGGEADLTENFLRPFGPQFGLKINGGAGPSQTLKKLNFNAPINIMPAGREGRAWGGDLIVVVGPGVGHLSDLVLPGEGIFESFFARRGDWRLGRKRLRPNICFPLPRFTHAPYGLERSGNHGGQREQAKAEWISLFCLQISYHVFDTVVSK